MTPIRTNKETGMNSTSQNDSAKREITVLFASGVTDCYDWIPMVMTAVFREHYAMRFTIKHHEREVRKAASLYGYDLIVLYVNAIDYDGEREQRFERALDMIRDIKQTSSAPVILLSLFYTPGFITAAEQAGVEAIFDTPFELGDFREQIHWALDRRISDTGVKPKSTETKWRPLPLRPRVVMLDDSPEVLALLSDVVRSLWEKATIVTCTDSYAAWEELQHRLPDLLITDLIHGGIDGFQLLARLAEHEVNYPIVVLSGNLPEREHEAREAAGENLRVSYWAKPIHGAEFGKGIKRLLERNL